MINKWIDKQIQLYKDTTKDMSKGRKIFTAILLIIFYLGAACIIALMIFLPIHLLMSSPFGKMELGGKIVVGEIFLLFIWWLCCR